jgi:CDP-glucose 4,6-dehydratase
VQIEPSFWSGRRVLVTGHTGFKGAWLALWLQSLGARVSGLSAGPVSTPSFYYAAGVGRGLSARQVDIRDHGAVHGAMRVERPEVVFHLAAQPVVRRSVREPRSTYEINVMGTVNLLEAIRTSDTARAAVMVTSDKCYENSERAGGRHPFSEQDPLGGSDPYSSSKACAELVIHAYRRSFFAGGDGPRVASARAGNVIGGGDWGEDRLVPDAIRAAMAGTALCLRNPEAVRPWQHVLDPLRGYLLLAQCLWEQPDVAEAWNFGPDPASSRPVRWVADRLAELWPGGVRWEPSNNGGPAEADYLMIDSAKARERLGWRPGLDLDAALQRVVEWYVALGEGRDMREVSLSQIQRFAA